MTRVLIVKPSSLGDVIHSLPVAAAFHRAGYHVTFAVRNAYRELVKMCGGVDAILPFPSRWSELPDAARLWRAQKFDAVIDLQGLLRSAALAKLARSPIHAGLPDARECSGLFYNRVATYPAGTLHAIERYLSILELFSLNTLSPSPLGEGLPPLDVQSGGRGEGCSQKRSMQTLDYMLAVPPAAQTYAAAYIHPETVVICPFTRRAEKQWPTDRFCDLIRSLVSSGRRPLLVGQGDDTAFTALPGCSSLINITSLPQLAAILKLAPLVVTLDSGPMHLAAAFGTPLIAIFGPTDPAKVGPYTPTAQVIRPASGRIDDITTEQVLTR